LYAQLLEFQQAGSESIVHIVIVVGDCVSDIHKLRFEPGLPAIQKSFTQLAKFARIASRAMFENALTRFVSEIQAGKIRVLRFEVVDDTQRLKVVLESTMVSHARIQGILSGMAERRVTEIVREADCLNKGLVDSKCARNGSRDLRNFQRVRQPGSIQIAFVIDENLRLVHQAAKCRRVNNSVPVPVILAAIGRRRLTESSTLAGRLVRRIRREISGRINHPRH
jgi:hypothetical protein